jgi:hypothetical protein
MNIKEQRSETRFTLTQKPKGMLFLHVRGDCFPVRAIRDISQTGISVLFDYDARQGDHVDIEYKDRGSGIKVSGTVVWRNRPDQQPAEAPHLLGINMLSPNSLLSFMQVA